MRTEVLVRRGRRQVVKERYWLVDIIPMYGEMTRDQAFALWGNDGIRMGVIRPVGFARLLVKELKNDRYSLLPDPLAAESSDLYTFEYVQHELPALKRLPSAPLAVPTQPPTGPRFIIPDAAVPTSTWASTWTGPTPF